MDLVEEVLDEVRLADEALAMDTQEPGAGSLYICTQRSGAQTMASAFPSAAALASMNDQGDDAEDGHGTGDADDDNAAGQDDDATDNAVEALIQHGVNEGSQPSSAHELWERPGMTLDQKKRCLRNFRYRVRKRLLGLHGLFQTAASIPGSDDCYLLLCDTGRANGTTAIFVGSRTENMDEQTKQDLQKLIVLLWHKNRNTREFASQLLSAALHGLKVADFLQGISVYIQHSYRLVEKGFMTATEWEKQCLQYEETLHTAEEIKCAKDARAKVHLRASTSGNLRSVAEMAPRFRKRNRGAHGHDQPKTVVEVERAERLRRAAAQQKSNQQGADGLRQPLLPRNVNSAEAPGEPAPPATTGAIPAAAQATATADQEGTAGLHAAHDARDGVEETQQYNEGTPLAAATQPGQRHVQGSSSHAQPATLTVTERVEAGMVASAASQVQTVNYVGKNSGQVSLEAAQVLSSIEKLPFVQASVLKRQGATAAALDLRKVCAGFDVLVDNRLSHACFEACWIL